MRVRWLEGAKQQLNTEILSQKSLKAMHLLNKEVQEVNQNLELFPEIGVKHTSPREDLRVVWVQYYRLTYVIDPDRDEVLVLSFISGRRKSDALD